MELGPEDTGPNLSFEQPQWLRDQETSTTFKNWIAEMLDLHCGRRPSAKSLGQRFHELLQHLSPVPTTTDQTTIWDKIREEFLCPKYLLGTDVPPPTYQGTLRFENVMPQGAIRAEQTKLLASADEMACAREILLGRKHNYTLWIKTRHAWIRHLVLGFIPRSRTVTTELFTNLLALKQVVLGLEHPETVAVQVGLAWSKAIDHPQEAVDLFIEGHNTQREALGQYHPETLSSKAGVAMAYLLQVTATKESFTDAVEPIPQQDGLHSNANDRERKEQLQIGVGMLEKVLDCQSNLEELGSNHPETAETMAILAWGYGLMERWEDAVRLYKQAADVQTHTLGNAHPDTIRTQIELGTIHLKLGNAVIAREYFDQALKMQDVLGVGQGETESAKRGRAETYKLERKMEAERLKRPRI
jgi:tetratricopeptide (TPR) repeat protein